MLTVSPSATSSPVPFTKVVTVVDSGASTSECHVAVRLSPTSPSKVTSDKPSVAVELALGRGGRLGVGRRVLPGVAPAGGEDGDQQERGGRATESSKHR